MSEMTEILDTFFNRRPAVKSPESRPYLIRCTIEDRAGSGAYIGESFTMYAYTAEDALFQLDLELKRQGRKYVTPTMQPANSAKTEQP